MFIYNEFFSQLFSFGSIFESGYLFSLLILKNEYEEDFLCCHSFFGNFLFL